MWLLIIVNLAGKLAAVLLFRTDLATALALWFGPDLLVAYHVFVPRAQGLLRLHRRFATPRREVWLTIDDGPDPVAHHTHTHPLGAFWCASPTSVRWELDAGRHALRAVGVKPARFRPPAGIRNPWLASALRARHLTAVGWSARGLERWQREPGAVADRVLRRLAPGAILLLHEGPGVPALVRVHAVRLVLERLRDQGYRCVVPAAGQVG